MNAYPLARSFPGWCPPALERAWRNLEQRRCIWAWLGKDWQVALCRRELRAIYHRASATRAAAVRLPAPSAPHLDLGPCPLGLNSPWPTSRS